MHSALILIDIQNDYFAGGKMELVSMDQAAYKASQLLHKFRKEKLPIFHIQHISIQPHATFFIPGTPGVLIHEAVKPLSDEIIITKHYPNSFRDTDLNNQLQQQAINKIYICGAMTHMCIDTTTRVAFDLGYKCIVVSDACATKDLFMHDMHVSASKVQTAYMASLNGMFAEVTQSNNLIIEKRGQA